MKRNVRKNFMLYLLIGVLGLGIGYAAVSNITLSINGSATANGSAEQENFIVRFVKSTDTSSDFESVRTSAQNPTPYEVSNGSTATVSSSITDDTHATFAITGLSSVGEYVDLTYYVTNLSDGIPAYISVDVENSTNDASEYFEITKTIVNDELLTQGSVTAVNVRVELIARPKLDKTGNFSVKLIASPTKEETGSGGTPSEPVQVNGATLVAAQTGETHKGIVYIDPTDLTATCTESDVTTNYTENGTNGLPTGIKTGCMKFYIFDDTGDTYTMILDHNTTAKVAYETSGTYKEYEQATIKSTVDSDTTGWVGSPRLITAQEIVTITNTTTFDGSSSKWFFFNGTGDNKQTRVSSSQGDNEYAWLFDYTNGCESYGCNTNDSSNYGYWTSSPTTDYSRYGWYVYSHGSLDCWGVSSASFPGVRPVITIDKSIFE